MFNPWNPGSTDLASVWCPGHVTLVLSALVWVIVCACACAVPVPVPRVFPGGGLDLPMVLVRVSMWGLLAVIYNNTFDPIYSTPYGYRVRYSSAYGQWINHFGGSCLSFSCRLNVHTGYVAPSTHHRPSSILPLDGWIREMDGS